MISDIFIKRRDFFFKVHQIQSTRVTQVRLLLNEEEIGTEDYVFMQDR